MPFRASNAWKIRSRDESNTSVTRPFSGYCDRPFRGFVTDPIGFTNRNRNKQAAKPLHRKKGQQFESTQSLLKQNNKKQLSETTKTKACRRHTNGNRRNETQPARSNTTTEKNLLPNPDNNKLQTAKTIARTTLLTHQEPCDGRKKEPSEGRLITLERGGTSTEMKPAKESQKSGKQTTVGDKSDEATSQRRLLKPEQPIKRPIYKSWRKNHQNSKPTERSLSEKKVLIWERVLIWGEEG